MIYRAPKPIRSFRQYRYVNTTPESVKWYSGKPTMQNHKETEKS